MEERRKKEAKEAHVSQPRLPFLFFFLFALHAQSASEHWGKRGGSFSESRFSSEPEIEEMDAEIDRWEEGEGVHRRQDS